MSQDLKYVSDVARGVVDVLKSHGADIDGFRGDVLGAALSTGRDISSTMDDDATRHLKAALQFLFALADAASPAPKSDDGNANPDVEGGFLT